jgi:deoxyribodipyrimidine photo-lyase
MAVRTLHDTGYPHNHARMWLASYVVRVRKVDWRIAADLFYGHLLDGDLASSHLSWQWASVRPESSGQLSSQRVC